MFYAYTMMLDYMKRLLECDLFRRKLVFLHCLILCTQRLDFLPRKLVASKVTIASSALIQRLFQI